MSQQIIHLAAESKYGFSGQYIAKLTGRAERVQFNRTFVGSKSGKRGELTTYETDEIGLYELCDVGKRGKDKSYVLVLPRNDGLILLNSDIEDALKIAKRLGAGERLEDIVVVELGEQLYRFESYCVCGECKIELLDSQKCTEHPEAWRSSETRQVPRLNNEGKPLRKLVYSIRSAKEVKAAETAATLDGAATAICDALRGLSESGRTKAVKMAKERLAAPQPVDGAA